APAAPPWPGRRAHSPPACAGRRGCAATPRDRRPPRPPTSRRCRCRWTRPPRRPPCLPCLLLVTICDDLLPFIPPIAEIGAGHRPLAGVMCVPWAPVGAGTVNG